jgi:hypothetical protein
MSNATPTPGKLTVLRRDNKTVVPFQADKIAIAITKAYLAVEGDQAAAASRRSSPARRHLAASSSRVYVIGHGGHHS